MASERVTLPNGEEMVVEYSETWDFDEQGKLVKTRTPVRSYKMSVEPCDIRKKLLENGMDPDRGYGVPYPDAPVTEWKTLDQLRQEKPGYLTLRFNPRTVRRWHKNCGKKCGL